MEKSLPILWSALDEEKNQIICEKMQMQMQMSIRAQCFFLSFIDRNLFTSSMGSSVVKAEK